jgi:hypothetical protein
VNFNVNCNVPLRKYILHPLVKIKKDFENIKMHGTTMKKRLNKTAILMLFT